MYFIPKFNSYILLVLFGLGLSAQNGPVKNGTYRIHPDSVSDGGLIELNGTWNFAWNKHVDPDHASPLADTIVVPEPWNEQGDFPKRGKGVYQLTLKNPEGVRDLALLFKGYYTHNYTLYVNGEEKISRRIHESNEEGAGGYLVVDLPPDSIIHVLAEVHSIGPYNQGILEAVRLGTDDEIQRQLNRKWSYEMFEFGLLIALMVFNLFFFFQVRIQAYLFISLICLAVVIRNSTAYDASLVMYNLFPSLTFVGAKRLEIIVILMAIPMVSLYTRSLFNDRRFKWIILSQLALSGLFSLIIFGLSYDQYVGYIYAILFLFIANFVITSLHAFRASREGRLGARALLIGFGIAFLFAVLELLKAFEVVAWYNLHPNYINAGLTIFLFFQSISATRIFSQSHFESHLINRDLESMVTQRTEELTKTHLIKDKLFSILTHDIRGPLNSLQGLLDIINQRTLSEDQQKLYLGRIGENVRVTKNMVEDILRWSSMNMGEDIFAMQTEKVNLFQMVEIHNDYYYERIKEKSIKFKNEIPTDLDIFTDPNFLKLVIRNLVSNALKFTPERGKIRVLAIKKDELTTISVYDSGIGIPDDLKMRLFEPDSKKQRMGTKEESGAGIGLMLCKDLIEQNGGRIWVKDNPTGGSLFMFTVKDITPAEEEEEDLAESVS